MDFFNSRTPWYFAGLCAAGLFSVLYISRPPASYQQSELASRSAEDLSCNCVVKGGETFTQLSFETPEECGPERDYYEGPLRLFKKLDRNGYYSQTRDFAQTARQIPRKCFLYSMKHTFPTQFNESIFGKCEGKVPTRKDPTDFTRTNFKPCVDEDLVNAVYNSYLDATDCFEVPPKFAVAKFMNESGVMPNIVASNNDAGLAQFSTGAMRILKQEYPRWSRRILNSKRASCRRLLSFPGAMPSSSREIVDDPNLKCHLIEIPANPVRNFIYYGVYYNIVMDDVNYDFNRTVRYLKKDSSGTVIDPNYVGTHALLKQARMERFDLENIKQTLAVMAYNTGPVAVTYFREWLAYRNTKFPTVPITEEDLNMEIPNPWAINDRKDSVEQIKAKWNIDDKRPMKFWEWMATSTKSHFRYASYVKFYANRLDRSFGPGVCTEPNFLE